MTKALAIRHLYRKRPKTHSVSLFPSFWRCTGLALLSNFQLLVKCVTTSFTNLSVLIPLFTFIQKPQSLYEMYRIWNPGRKHGNHAYYTFFVGPNEKLIWTLELGFNSAWLKSKEPFQTLMCVFGTSKLDFLIILLYMYVKLHLPLYHDSVGCGYFDRDCLLHSTTNSLFYTIIALIISVNRGSPHQ